MAGLEAAWRLVEDELETARNESSRSARKLLTRELRTALQRFRHYETEQEWVATLLDSVAPVTREAAVFYVRGDRFVLAGSCGLELGPGYTLSSHEAPAMQETAQSRDVVVALRTSKELGPVLGGASGQQALLLPVANGTRVAAVLFTALEADTETELLELCAAMASIVLERQSNAVRSLQIAPVPAAAVTKLAGADPGKRMPPWMDLREEERNLHMRAQRYARVKAAEMQLAHPDAAQAGREQNNVYLFLKGDIDAARDSYQAQFLQGAHMIDYLHLELVRTACEGDEEKLGVDYPGQLG